MASGMRVICSCVLVLLHFCGFVSSQSSLACSVESSSKSTAWVDMVDSCVCMVKRQIRREVTASMSYVNMGAHFSRDTINRPGFAKMFFDSAKEEREHAIKLIDYLLMRGETLEGLKDILFSTADVQSSKAGWKGGVEALNDALDLEKSVTDNIKSVIKHCESQKQKPDECKKQIDSTKNVNDYHLVDYLTGVYLEEQYHSQRDLAGKLYTLAKMQEKHGVLGEFLFDKKLLYGEVPAFG